MKKRNIYFPICKQQSGSVITPKKQKKQKKKFKSLKLLKLLARTLSDVREKLEYPLITYLVKIPETEHAPHEAPIPPIVVHCNYNPLLYVPGTRNC